MVNRPACKNEYKREEEKKQERHFVKVQIDWDEKPPPSKAPEKDTKKERMISRISLDYLVMNGKLFLISLMMDFHQIIKSDNKEPNN